MDEEEKYKIFANKRSDRVYISKRIDSNVIRRDENGEMQTISRPVRIVSKIVAGDDDYRFLSTGEDVVLRTTGGKRLQIKATFYEDLRDVRVLTIQKYSLIKGVPKELYFSFVGPEIETLYNFIRNVALLPLDEQGKRTLEDTDVATLRLSRDQALRVLQDQPELVEELIRTQVTAGDIAQLGYRRAQLEEFRRLLDSREYFDRLAGEVGKPEAVWQSFFERNTWIFGYGLNYFLNSNLDQKKLEQVVASHDIAGRGKRVDALLKTRGLISSMSFGEIKTHRSALLRSGSAPYRPEAWQVSDELSGGVAQIQRTVQRALEKIGTQVRIKDESGNPTSEQIYLYHPRSFLVIGSLAQFQTEHGINEDKYSSFELFRRNIASPEIITFDELYSRATYIVEAAKTVSIGFPQSGSG
jgi:Domain of unknown function (DUF4263)